MGRSVFSFRGVVPQFGQVFLAPGCRVIGNVAIAEKSSVWHNAVLRGDAAAIRVGKWSNIQDNAVLHVMEGLDCELGDYVSVGHNAVLHSCKVSDRCLIGMGAILLNGAEIGEDCIIGAGALITEGKKIPPQSLVLGSPGKVIRQITDQEKAGIIHNCIEYYEYSLDHEKCDE